MSTLLSLNLVSTWNGNGVRAARNDLRSLNNDLVRTNAVSRSITGLGLNALMTAALATAPALVPVAAAVVSVGAATVALGTSGGGALGIYGLAMGGAVKKTMAMKTSAGLLQKDLVLQRKILSQLTPGTAAYEKQLKKVNTAQDRYNHALAEATPGQRAFITATLEMTSAWRKFITDTQETTLTTAAIAVAGVTTAIGKLAPVVRAVDPIVRQVATAFKDWTERSDGLDRAIRTITIHGVPALTGLAAAGRNVLKFLGDGFRAFAPLGTAVAFALARGAAALARWSSGGGFERFIERVRANSPAVKEFFKALLAALPTLAEAFAGMANPALLLATALLKIVAALPPGLIQALVISFIAFRTVMIGMMIAKAVATAINLFGKAMLFARFCAFALEMSLLPFLGIVALVLVGIASLILIILNFGEILGFLRTKWGLFIALLGPIGWLILLAANWRKAWDAIKAAAIAVWNALKAAWSVLWNALKVVFDAAIGFLRSKWGLLIALFGPIGWLVLLASRWSTVWNAIKAAAVAVWNALKAAWGKIWPVMKAAWNAFIGPIKTAWNKIWPELKAAAESVWNNMKTVWSGLWTAMQAVWTAFVVVFGPVFQALWTAIVAVATTVWATLRAAWGALWASMQLAWSVFVAVFVPVFQALWTAIVAVATAVWATLKIAWQLLWTTIQAVWTAFVAVFVPVFQALWTGIVAVATAVWEILKAAWSVLWTTITAVFLVLFAIFTGHWGAAWNAIKDAAIAIWNLIKAAWNLVVQSFMLVWTTVSAALAAAWNAFWTLLGTVTQAIWTALRAAWQAFVTALHTIWITVSALFSAAWNMFWNAIKLTATTIWTAMQAAWSAFITALQTIWTTVSAALSAAWSATWNAMHTAASAIWAAMQAAWSAFISALQSTWTSVSAALSSAWSATWNAMKTAGQAIWTAMQSAWNTAVTALKSIWDKAAATIKAAWDTFWKGLQTTATSIWTAIKDAVQKGVDAVITVIKKIVGVWNTITKAVGLDSLSISIGAAEGGVIGFQYGGIAGMPEHFAKGGTAMMHRGGGVLSGYAPGKDTVPAVLSRGEGVLVPEAVSGLGPDFVHWANYYYSGGRGGKNVAYPGYAPGKDKGGAPGHFALGGITAWHKDAPNGWHGARGGIAPLVFQGGGVVTLAPGEIPIPPGPGGVGGGTVGQDPGKGVNQPTPVLTGAAAMILGFIGEAAIRAAFEVVSGALSGLNIAGDWGKILIGGTKAILEGMIKDLIDRDSKAKKEYESMAVAGSQSVQAWAPLAAQALALAGLAASQLGAFLALMQAESGGNPNAINTTDINAQNGIPSQGLMQVIPPTFAAYHVAGTSNNILDPLANMAAAANYIKARYGGIVPGSPYAKGTSSATPGLHLVGEKGPELAGFMGGETVVPAEDTAAAMTPPASTAPAIGAVAPAGAAGIGAKGAIPATDDANGMDFDAIVAAAQAMVEAVKAAWAAVTAAGVTAKAGMGVTFADITKKAGTDLPVAFGTMKTGATTAWTAMGTQSAATWAMMRDGTYAEYVLKTGTEVPASNVAMQTANATAWTDMGVQSAAQWAAMRDVTFAEANDHMAVQMPAWSQLMDEGVVTAWSDMDAATTTQWGKMRDGTFAEANEMMATKMPAWSGTMQTSVQGSWDSLETGTQTSWTAVEGSITTSVTAATAPINGLLTGFNNVSTALGSGTTVPLVSFSTGGVAGFNDGGVALSRGGTLPGYSPGKDTVPALLSRGEGILTPEAVRGIGGSAAIDAINYKYAGHRGAGKRGAYVDSRNEGGFALGGMVLRFAGGGTITAQDAAGLAEAGVSTGSVTQGSFNTSVAASGSTHAGDGVVDLSDLGAVQRLRDAGWAAWERTPAQGFAYHVHAVYMKATGVDPSAMGQEISYINGGIGLPAGSASASELNGWGLNLGEWNFGPLLKNIVAGQNTDVPPGLKPIVLKKLTAEQVTEGFADLKAAMDGADLGPAAMWADGLHGMGNKIHEGIVSSITSQTTGGLKSGTSYASRGWHLTGENGPEMWHAKGGERIESHKKLKDLFTGRKSGGEGGDTVTFEKGCVQITITGNATPQTIDKMETELVPKLRRAWQSGVGRKTGR